MLYRRVSLHCFILLFLTAVIPTGLHSQTISSGVVTGVVTDATGGIVPGVSVTLTDQATNFTQTTVTDSAGRYLFPAVKPALYAVKCSMKGFRTVSVPNVKVEVLKTTTLDLKLEVGQTTEIIEVVAGAGATLQTENASIGDVLGGDAVLRMPQQQRSITALLMLQPGASPAMRPASRDDINGGQIAGASPDQSTFFVDGGDATSDLEGTNNYVSPPGEPQPAPFIAVPAEWTQEFRVVTASPTASYSRSMGGEVSVLTKSGANNFHGSAYEYYYGSATSGNTWLNNSIGRNRPHQVNNRFGASTGGRILKDKLFFFGGYEGRRLYQSSNITQLVPTDSARQGILAFNDCSSGFDADGKCLGGNAVQYNAKDFDPRGIGMSPLIADYFKLLPEPNNFSVGDHLNSAGYTASFALPVKETLAVARLDYNINQKWALFGTFHYNKYEIANTNQFDITVGHTPHVVSNTPVQPRFVTFMLTGQVGSHFTTQTHGSYLHDWWNWNRQDLAPQLPGTDGALNLSGEARLAGTGGGSKVWGDPVNFDTQDARARVWGGKDWFIGQDATWLHGSHTIQFGGGYYFWNLTHTRTDDVTGGLTTGPTYYLETTHNGGSYLHIPASDAPPRCSAADNITTNCLPSSTAFNRWSNMYGSLLGLVDRSAQIGVRDGDFNGSPLGTMLKDHVHTHSFSTYIQDSWKIKPSITLTYGLTYGVQFAPHELDGKQVVEVWSNTNTPVQNILSYFKQRNNALSNGQFFASGLTADTDSTFGFSPIRHIPAMNGSSSRTQWDNFGPRVAVAWNVPWNNRIFGDKKTVIRAGYSLLWNRTSAVGQVLTPLLGNGLASINSCAGPTFATGSSTAVCTGGATNPTDGFRLGVDGSTVPVPPTETAPIPLIPGSPYSAKSGTSDPAIHLPYSHMVSVDIQRSFPQNWLLDIGFIGRYAHNLWQNQDINATDLYAKTPACSSGQTGCNIATQGQTLAQAYNAVNAAVNAGNPVIPQPFFENAPFGCLGCTAAIADADGGDPSLAYFMLFNYDTIAPRPLDPMQFGNGGSDNITTDGGWSHYNALFVSVHKSMSQGLDFSLNYTWSHGIGTGGWNFVGQQYTAYSSPTSFDLNSGVTANSGDRRHVINAAAYYLLPFGKGRHFATNNFLDRIVGGWYVSGIYTWRTGLPWCVGADGDFGSPDGYTCAVGPKFSGKTSPHHGVIGSNGIGDNANPATGGSGMNLFADPAAVYNALRMPLPGVDGRPGTADLISTPREWNIDLGIGKNILATERYKLVFSAELLNAFNHPLFGSGFGPSLDLGDPHGFGVISSADNDPRSIQFGLRFEF